MQQNEEKLQMYVASSYIRSFKSLQHVFIPFEF